MGGWNYIQPGIEWVLDHLGAKFERPRFVGRAASAATATGLMKRHLEERAHLIDEALTTD